MRSRARTHRRVLITVAALAAAMAIPQLASAAAAPVGRVSDAVASAVPRYQHIAVVLMTHHGYKSILGNLYAPTINQLAGEYGLASHYFTTSDPDVADMMALLTGGSHPSPTGCRTGTSS